jgi:hypothetical protein
MERLLYENHSIKCEVDKIQNEPNGQVKDNLSDVNKYYFVSSFKMCLWIGFSLTRFEPTGGFLNTLTKVTDL